MTGNISSSLNLVLSRLNSIESNFSALENIANSLNAQSVSNENNIPQTEFKTILDAKIKEVEKKEDKSIEKNEEKKVETPEKTVEKISSTDDEIILLEKILEKESVNLKSKIDLNRSNIDEIVETFSNKYGVDGDFVKAIIKQESGFNPNARSKKGAMGLMQLMPKTAESLGVINAYNPWENVEGGVKFLKNLLDKYDNNHSLALAAYNAGPGAVKKYGGIPPYKETQNYVNSIMSAYNKVKGAKI